MGPLHETTTPGRKQDGEHRKAEHSDKAAGSGSGGGTDDRVEDRDDEIDEAVEESFPASDPPSWSTPGKAGGR